MKKKTKNALKKALAMLLNLGLGAGMALAAVPWAMKNFGDQSILVFEGALIGALLVFGLLGYVVMVVMHEGGHLIAGLMSGYTFVSFRVFNLMLLRLNGKLCFKRFSLAGTGGQCLMKPPAWTAEGIPVRLYNWGGVLVNLLVCLLILPVVLMNPMDTMPGMIGMMIMVLNVYAVLANGLPMMNNDADNALHLMHDRNAQFAFWQQMMANALLTEGVPMLDMPQEVFTLAEDADLGNPLIAATAVNAVQMHMVRHDFDEAERSINALLNDEHVDLVLVHRFLLKNDLLWLELLRGKRKEVIASLEDKEFKQYRKAMASNPSVIRTAYTEALATGDEKAMAKQQALMDKAVKSYPYAQEIEHEQGLMRYAEEQLKQ